MSKILIVATFLTLLLAESVHSQTDDSSQVYQLGRVIIEAPAIGQALADGLPATKIEKMNRLTVSEALNLLPGLTQSNVGPRNESVIFVRGFDLRQVPLFIDGIPVYIPMTVM